MIRVVSVLDAFAAASCNRASSKAYTFGDMSIHTASLLPKTIGSNITTIDSSKTRSGGEEGAASVGSGLLTATSGILRDDNEDRGVEGDSSDSVDAVGHREKGFRRGSMGLILHHTRIVGDFKLLAKGIQATVKCTRDMIGLTKSLAKYVRSIKVSDPQTSQAKLFAILYQSDNVIFDLPVAVADCLGIRVDDSVKFAKRVLSTAELTLKEVMANSDSIVSSWDSFTAFMKNITLPWNQIPHAATT
ncbi:hypothetical protein ON010_g8817 [Phytophthora cinnamomi]|nr:hypothetical protein ON010_g8817 [Phytophthora cinnamomi]